MLFLSFTLYSPAADASASAWTLAEPLEHFYRVKKEISTYKNVPSPQVSARSNTISPTNMTALNSSGWSSRLENAKLSCVFRCISTPPKLTECPSDLIGPINKLFMLQNSSEGETVNTRRLTENDGGIQRVTQRRREWISELDKCHSLSGITRRPPNDINHWSMYFYDCELSDRRLINV